VAWSTKCDYHQKATVAESGLKLALSIPRN
jgi:hypothetical protein